jgi:hypothetical protein
MSIDKIWHKIRAHEGEVFYTKTGKPFTYHTKGSLIVLENTNRNIPIGNIEKALSVINPSVVEFQRMNLQGPSYLYGIITDSRIKE